jgi:hypothetical protein
MANSFIYVSNSTYYDMEAYFIKLALYTDSMEYLQLHPIIREKMDREIISIHGILDFMNMFREIPKKERAIVAWKVPEENEDKNKFKRYLRFSSPIVASKVIGVQVSNITRCCDGDRPTAGGYYFVDEDEHIETVNKVPKWYDH